MINIYQLRKLISSLFFVVATILISTSGFAQVTITASGNTNFCQGGSVTLSVPAIYNSYLWSNGATTSSVIVTTGSGAYFTTVMDGGGSTFFSDTVMVTIDVAAIADAGADITACSDNIIGLGGLLLGSASNGTWVGGAGTFDPNRTTLNPNYTPDPSEYGTTVTLTLVTDDPAGVCPRDSDNVDLTILQSPALQPFGGFYQNTCPDTTFDLSTLTVIDSNNTSGFITYHDDMFNALLDSVVAPPIGVPTIYYVFKTTNTTPSCFDFESVVILMQACSGCTPPSMALVGDNVSCNGDNDGSADLSVTGGTMPYTYAWSNSATTEDIIGLAPGTYTVTVTDAQPCTATLSVTITEPLELTDTASVSNETVLGANDGMIDHTAMGGTSPYTYAWSTGATTEDINGLAPAMYCVTTTDANGCTVSSCYTVNAGPTAVAGIEDSKELYIFPNPARETITLKYDFVSSDAFEILVVDIQGRTVRTIDNIYSGSSAGSIQIDVSELLEGTYLLQVKNAGRTYYSRFAVLH